MKKAISLVELIIAVILMGVIILGAFSFDLASRGFFRSSETKVEVVNDLTFVLEHLHKNIMQGVGTVDNPALVWNSGSGVLTINQDDGAGGTTPVTYEFDPAANTITFGANDVLTRRLEALDLSSDIGVDADSAFYINEMVFQYDPASDTDPRENPQATIKEQYFFPSGQSLS